ncbi:hypothetical protein DJ018_01515 [Phenylobacterium deserti]|uniref:Uncharacterized protein n=2 Tax=Phenylobacterium deserti TaxID=1914756 RepID=A0A328AT54_9CAUL|nr:hypothetical protein DJ018_01515 [Phenylobacterium deserti]
MAGSAWAAPQASSLSAPAWVITPVDNLCRTELELTGRSGGVAPAALTSDGREVRLVFAKEDAPERAFLSLRINQKPFSNLVVRGAEPGLSEMVLSDETLSALRKGGVLQVGWLSQEPVSLSLSGSDQGLADLRTCGAQVAAQWRERQSAQAQAKAQSDADARAKALAAEQLAAVRAQRAAAEAERTRLLAEADRQRALADAERRRVEAEQADYEQSRWEPAPEPYRGYREYPPAYREYPRPAPRYGYRPYD